MERGAIRHQLAPNTSLILETAGIGNAVQTGHAILYSLDNKKLGAKSVVRNAELKASLTLPLSPEREDRLVLPFDNTDGAKTSFLWISETPYAMVDFVFLDSDGKELLKGSHQFTSQTSSTRELFLLEERFPALKGRRGIVQMQASYPGAGFYDELLLTALVLQSDPDGTTAVIPSMATNSWKSMRY